MVKAPHVRIVTATEAKNNFGAIIKSAYAMDEHLIVEKSGIPVVAIIPMADYQQLVNNKAPTMVCRNGWTPNSGGHRQGGN